MEIIPETKQNIVAIISQEFRCFRGGNYTEGNPISEALRGEPPSFAGGVDVEGVVERILELGKLIK